MLTLKKDLKEFLSSRAYIEGYYFELKGNKLITHSVVSFMFLVWGLLIFLDLWVYTFQQIWIIFSHYFFKKCSVLLPAFRTPITHIWGRLKLSYSSAVMLFSFRILLCIISIAMPSNSLIFSSCDLWSVIDPIQCIFHVRHYSFNF